MAAALLLLTAVGVVALDPYNYYKRGYADHYTEDVQRDFAARGIEVGRNGPISVEMFGQPSNIACTGLLAGMADGSLRQACCPKSCGKCDDVGCEHRGDGAAFCCPSKIMITAPSCERKEHMKDRTDPDAQGMTNHINFPPCVIEEDDGYTEDAQGFLRKKMYSSRGVFMGYDYKAPPVAAAHNTHARAVSANRSDRGYWDSADGKFRYFDDTAVFHKKVADGMSHTLHGGDVMEATTGDQIRLTPKNDKRPVCTRIPCKEGEVMVVHANDGLPEFYKTKTPYGDMYMTTGPKKYLGAGMYNRPSFDRWGRFMPPKNVDYAVKPTTDCCKATCANPTVLAQAKAASEHGTNLTDAQAETACGYGCGMWLHSSSLNWESNRWHAALRDRCARDCTMPRKWKQTTHFTYGGQPKTTLGQMADERNNPFLAHALAKNGTLADEEMCKKGCQFYYMCIGTRDIIGANGARGATWASAAQTPAENQTFQGRSYTDREAFEGRFLPKCDIRPGLATCNLFTDFNNPICHEYYTEANGRHRGMSKGHHCLCPEGTPRCPWKHELHGVDRLGRKMQFDDNGTYYPIEASENSEV